MEDKDVAPDSDEELRADLDADEGPEKVDKTDEDSPEVEGREAVLEKRFKDTQRKLTEVATEKAQLAERLARLEGRLDERLGNDKTEEPDPFSFLNDEDAELLDDPKNVRNLIKKTVGALAGVLGVRDQALYSRVAAELEKRDPTVREMRDKIEELREDGDYAEFSDRQLAVIAKKQLGRKKDDEEDDDGFRGSVGGGRKTATKKRDPVDSEVDAMMKKIGYDRFD